MVNNNVRNMDTVTTIWYYFIAIISIEITSNFLNKYGEIDTATVSPYDKSIIA